MTTASPSHFRLRPYVFLVQGAARSALYDLHRRRIYPIPASAAFVLDRCENGSVADMLEAIGDPDDREMALQYLERFGEMDFGRYHDDVRTLVPYRDRPPDYVMGRVATLSFDLRMETDERDAAPDWVDIARKARKSFGCGQLTLFVRGDAESEGYEMGVAEAAAALRLHHIEVVFPDATVGAEWEALAARLGLRIALQAQPESTNPTYRRLQEARLPVRFVAGLAPAPISTRTLVCNHASFRLLRNLSVHCNSLHVDARGRVFPWALEKHHLIGHVTDAASLERLMRSAELRQAWSFNKDSVDVCRDCEFRYACPQSYTFRKDAERVGSAPANCGYDPSAGVWRNAPVAGLFDAAADDQRVEQAGRYFQTVSHVRNPLPEPYVRLLDDVVDRAVETLGIDPPAEPIVYLYYPSSDVLRQEIAQRDGIHVSGLTEYNTDGGRTVIRTGYPGHAHEVVHALLFSVNPEPRFFVSEACATIFGACWGTPEDVMNGAGALEQSNVRITNAAGEDIEIEGCLVYDDKGLFVGPLRRGGSVHATARHFIHVLGVKPFLHSWFHAVDEGGLPRFFYEIGGSFFLWLIETRGRERFLEFYRSKQTLRHLEGYYAADISTLIGQWTAFLSSVN